MLLNYRKIARVLVTKASNVPDVRYKYRTILMDARDSISHHLDYKQEIDVKKIREEIFML